MPRGMNQNPATTQQQTQQQMGQQPGQMAPGQGGQASGVQFQLKERYSGECVPLQKPNVQTIMSVVGTLDSNKVAKLGRDQAEMQLFYFEQPEVKKLQDTLKKLANELKDQVNENLEEKKQLHNMFDKYDTLFA